MDADAHLIKSLETTAHDLFPRGHARHGIEVVLYAVEATPAG